MQGPPTDIDGAVRSAHAHADYGRAADLALAAFGPEIHKFVRGELRSAQRGDDAFSDFSLAVVRGIAGFRFQSSVRTWLYTVARNVCKAHAERAGKQAERHVELGGEADVSAAFRGREHETTALHKRTTMKREVRRLRELLDDEERTILALHVDQGLTFAELAKILKGDPDLEGAALEREAARIRVRFARSKEKLTEAARAQGLLPPGSPRGAARGVAGDD